MEFALQADGAIIDRSGGAWSFRETLDKGKPNRVRKSLVVYFKKPHNSPLNG